MGKSVEKRLSDIERSLKMISLQTQFLVDVQELLLKPQFLSGLQHELSNATLTVESQYSGLFGGIGIMALAVALFSLGIQSDSLTLKIGGSVLGFLSLCWFGYLWRRNKVAVHELEQAKCKFAEYERDLEEFGEKLEKLAKVEKKLAKQSKLVQK